MQRKDKSDHKSIIIFLIKKLTRIERQRKLTKFGRLKKKKFIMEFEEKKK